MSNRALLIVIAFIAAGLTGSLASAETSPQTFTACLTSKGALVKVAIGTSPSSTCARGERQISWNAQGPAGTPGAVGPEGPAGKDGADGADGADGKDGMTITGTCPAGQFVTSIVDGQVVCGGISGEITSLYVFLDNDNDGFGNATRPLPLINGFPKPAGYVTNAWDCADDNFNIKPGPVDQGFDGFDSNCDGEDGVRQGSFWFPDADGDGFGAQVAPTYVFRLEQPPAGYVPDQPSDCDDTNPNRFPGNTDEPGNGIDENCTGSDGWRMFPDADGDGFGVEPSQLFDDSFPPPLGFVFEGEQYDCDDTDFALSPAAYDSPNNGIDENCDGTFGVWVDVDGDGVPVYSIAVAETELIFDGSAWDCDDNDPARNSTLPDLPNNLIDENCDGNVPVFIDQDGDRYGTDVAILDIAPEYLFDDGRFLGGGLFGGWSYYSVSNGDCDDFDPSAFPGNPTPDLGNLRDEDCDGLVDEDVLPPVGET